MYTLCSAVPAAASATGSDEGSATEPGGHKPSDKEFVTFDQMYGNGGDFDQQMEERVARRRVRDCGWLMPMHADALLYAQLQHCLVPLVQKC